MKYNEEIRDKVARELFSQCYPNDSFDKLTPDGQVGWGYKAENIFDIIPLCPGCEDSLVELRNQITELEEKVEAQKKRIKRLDDLINIYTEKEIRVNVPKVTAGRHGRSLQEWLRLLESRVIVLEKRLGNKAYH